MALSYKRRRSVVKGQSKQTATNNKRKAPKKKGTIVIIVSIAFFFTSIHLYFTGGTTVFATNGKSSGAVATAAVATNGKSSGTVATAALGRFSGSIDKNADEVWNDMLKEGAQLMEHHEQTNLAAIEVGMHRATQCIEAARSNFEAYCLEPSPRSFHVIEASVQEVEKEVKDRIHLLNIAAGDSSGVVNFSSGGSTGDMIGGADSNMWTMTKSQTDNNEKKNSNLVEVTSARLDDVIAEHIPASTDIFIAKIDVQGFEPHVFGGLSNSIKHARIMFLLFEYWPKGMDFMMDQAFDGNGICKASVKILADLQAAGYKLFALHPMVHPHSYSHGQTKQRNLPPALKGKKLVKVVGDRPLDDLMANCKWYYKLEQEIFPQEDYFMGFWSDIIAVSPTAKLEKSTLTGRSIAEHLKE